MQAQIAINGTLYTVTPANWDELWQWLIETVEFAGEPVRTIGIVIKGH